MDRLCTIIAQNYLPQAMALLDSARKIYPDIDFYVLITDDASNVEPFLPTANVMTPEDLEIDPLWLAEMRSYYDPVELATSLKPFLLRTLLTDGISSVTFLDPDILIYSELADGFSAAHNVGIALAPHRLTTSNILNGSFSELAFLQYGIFNLGYIAVGQKGRDMLNWWAQRLRWYCTRFPNDVVFTDQKWMNFVPALFDCKVIKNFGYDLAPWNIDERPLSLVNGEYLSGPDQLVFIHFSQMSGQLAVGLKTPLWKSALAGLPEHRDSLHLVLDLTEKYSKILVDNGKLLRTRESKDLKEEWKALPSIHHRRALIMQSLANARGEPPLKRSVPKFFYIPFKKLERSNTFNGMMTGLQKDLPKISQRFRRLFHK